MSICSKGDTPGRAGVAFGRYPFPPRRCREPGKRPWPRKVRLFDVEIHRTDIHRMILQQQVYDLSVYCIRKLRRLHAATGPPKVKGPRQGFR